MYINGLLLSSFLKYINKSLVFIKTKIYKIESLFEMNKF